MKRSISLILLTFLFLSGCSQVVTAPVHFAGAVVTNTIEVVDATVEAVSDDEEEEDEIYYEE